MIVIVVAKHQIFPDTSNLKLLSIHRAIQLKMNRYPVKLLLALQIILLELQGKWNHNPKYLKVTIVDMCEWQNYQWLDYLTVIYDNAW